MLLLNYNPIQVESYEIRDEHLRPVTNSVPVEKRTYVRIFTTNGDIYVARRVPLEHAFPRGWPDNKPQLFVTRAGNFFSLSASGCAQVKPSFHSQTEEHRKSGGN